MPAAARGKLVVTAATVASTDFLRRLFLWHDVLGGMGFSPAGRGMASPAASTTPIRIIVALSGVTLLGGALTTARGRKSH